MEEWRQARLELLAKEKEYNKLGESINAARRDLPMVPVTKDYVFSSADGPKSLKDLFGDKSQLIIYHHMFEPESDEGCHGCSFIVSTIPDVRHLAERDVAVAVVSRAPIEKVAPYQKKNNWISFPWVSSSENTFSYDFNFAFDEAKSPIEYSFKSKKDLEEAGEYCPTGGDVPSFGVFSKGEDGKVYLTYFTYGGIINTTGVYQYLNMTQKGPQDPEMGPAAFKTPAEFAEEAKASA